MAKEWYSTNTNSPYCGVGILSDPEFDGFATIVCATTPFAVPVYADPTGTGNTVFTTSGSRPGGSTNVGGLPTESIPSNTSPTGSTRSAIASVSTVALPTSTTQSPTTPTTPTTQATRATAIATVTSAQAVPTNFPLGLVIAGCAVAFLNPI
jgi:hypothetical protein